LISKIEIQNPTLRKKRDLIRILQKTKIQYQSISFFDSSNKVLDCKMAKSGIPKKTKTQRI